MQLVIAILAAAFMSSAVAAATAEQAPTETTEQQASRVGATHAAVATPSFVDSFPISLGGSRHDDTWEKFCGDAHRSRCLLLYSAALLLLFAAVSALCAVCLVRWLRRSGRGQRTWHRLEADDVAAADGAQEGLLAADGQPRHSTTNNGDDDEDALEDGDGESDGASGGRRSFAGRVVRSLRRLNLHGTRLWTVLRMTPAGLFYGASTSATSSSSAQQQPQQQQQESPSHSASLSSAEPRDDTSSEVDSSHHSWDLQRDSHTPSTTTTTTTTTAVGSRAFLRTVVSVATTTADSSESGNDSSVHHSDDGEATAPHRRRNFICDPECLNEEATEDECAVGRSAMVIQPPPHTPLTPHVLPQLIHYPAVNEANRSGVDGDADDDFAYGDNTDSDSQQLGRAAGETTARTSTTSLTASHNSSTHTPPPARLAATAEREDDNEVRRGRLPQVESAESVLRSDGDEDDRSPMRSGFPHVETAIFDTTTNACCATNRSSTVDLSVLNDLFEPDHFPPGTHVHGGSEAPTSSGASHISVLECCYIPPPANSGTATPSSLRESNVCLPLPVALTAALPVSHSLSDGLDMAGEAAVDDHDASPQSRSYVPVTQQQQQQQYFYTQPTQVQKPPLPPTPSPPVTQTADADAAAKAPKRRRRRSSSRYSEPWQPVLVTQPVPQLMAAAAVTALPLLSVPVSAAADAAAAAALPSSVRSRSLDPPRSPMSDLGGELEDELDDLMLGDDESAQSNYTGESGHIFSGSSTTSTSRTVTPAAENEQENLCTPTMFCPTALANGNGGSPFGYVTVIPPASASIPVRAETTPVALLARTADAARTLLGRDNGSPAGSPTWASCSVGRRPLNLSVEERTLLMKSRKWLFPLIDGVDEIESSIAEDAEAERPNEHVRCESSESQQSNAIISDGL